MYPFICLIYVPVHYMQAIYQRIKSHEEGSVAILSCGEGLFPIRRLSQLAQAYEASTGIAAGDYLSRIHIEQCNNTEEALDTMVNNIIKFLCSHNDGMLCLCSTRNYLICVRHSICNS
jgi:hypothetical protein